MDINLKRRNSLLPIIKNVQKNNKIESITIDTVIRRILE